MHRREIYFLGLLLIFGLGQVLGDPPPATPEKSATEQIEDFQKFARKRINNAEQRLRWARIQAGTFDEGKIFKKLQKGLRF